MRTIAAKYPANSPFATEVEAAKLKLKNACPDALDNFIYKQEKKAVGTFRKMFGLKPPTPIAIHALADLRIEATYAFDGKEQKAQAPSCPWAAAKSYVALKDIEVNVYAGKPLPKRSSSSTSTLSSQGSQKSVRFAEIEAEIKEFDKFAAPKDI